MRPYRCHACGRRFWKARVQWKKMLLAAIWIAALTVIVSVLWYWLNIAVQPHKVE